MLDTNMLIYFFKDMGKVSVNLLAQAPRDILIPAVVLYEMETGLAKSNSPEKRREQLAELLAVVEVVPFDDQAARKAALVRAQLETGGQMIEPLDNLIAGTALAANAVLVTRNIREFARVPGLQLENWFD